MADHVQSLSLIVNLVRSGRATTRPELVRATDLGRNIVAQRVGDAIDLGLLAEEPGGVSTGGRPSKVLAVSRYPGVVLSAVFGVTRLHLVLTDLAGTLLDERFRPWDVTTGPDASMRTLTDIAGEVLAGWPDRHLWAVTVGLPGPVDFARGIPVSPPIMPGWDGYPVGTYLERHFGAPVWVDNDANLMALGAWDRTRHIAGGNVVLIKAGTGIGAGILSRGRLHRGARGAAGDFGHVVVSGESGVQCRCGLFGCLEALAGGWALARDARDAVYARRSTWLQRRLDETGTVTGEDVIQGCLDGDAVCEHLITRSGTLIGQQLATLVSILNPSTVFLAGSLVRSGPRFLDAIASAVKPRALVLATDELLITPVPLNHYEGVIGGATLAADELFAPGMLARWLANGTPRGLSAGTCIAADTATELPPMRQRTRLMAELSEARNG